MNVVNATNVVNGRNAMDVRNATNARNDAPTICVCMIVKNEQHVIRRALQSVRDWIDYWVICDTGSTDGTPAAVLQALCGVPGELHRTEWVSFGHNRTEALRLAKDKADYALIIDADMIANLHGDLKAALAELAADCCYVRYEGALDYSQIMLVSTRHDWQYVGTTHEYIWSESAAPAVPIHELTLTHFGDGGMRADKYERDADLLMRDYERDPTNARTAFYLAQSYRDLGNLDEALAWYERRADLDGWDEETFAAKFQAGRMRLQLGHAWPVVRDALLEAYAYRPTRLEPLGELARACRQRGDFAQGYLFSTLYDRHPYPADRLFIDRPVYEYQLALEHGVCAHAIGARQAALRAFTHVLNAKMLPDWAADAAIRGTRVCLDPSPRPGPPTRGLSALGWRPSPRKRGEGEGAPVELAVIVPFHNPGHFFDNCVESLLTQDYSHPHVRFIFVDDGSDDGSGSWLPAADPRVIYHRQSSRRGSACGIYTALTRYVRPTDIVVHVDGDDWLSRPDALSMIADAYRDPECWVRYGQYETTDGDYGICRPFDSRASFARVRERWWTSHVKTYRAGLFFRLAEQDPNYSCLKDAAGEWLRVAVDAALMYPLLELAGFEHVRFSDDVLYVYNTDNASNVHRCQPDEQRRVFREIQQRQRFRPVDHWAPAQVEEPIEEPTEEAIP